MGSNDEQERLGILRTSLVCEKSEIQTKLQAKKFLSPLEHKALLQKLAQVEKQITEVKMKLQAIANEEKKWKVVADGQQRMQAAKAALKALIEYAVFLEMENDDLRKLQSEPTTDEQQDLEI